MTASVPQQNLYVALESGTKRELTSGQYTYPFQFQLPSNGPTSFEGQHGYLRYWVKVIIDRPWNHDQSAKKVFTLICPVDLNREPSTAHGGVIQPWGTVSVRGVFGPRKRGLRFATDNLTDCYGALRSKHGALRMGSAVGHGCTRLHTDMHTFQLGPRRSLAGRGGPVRWVCPWQKVPPQNPKTWQWAGGAPSCLQGELGLPKGIYMGVCSVCVHSSTNARGCGRSS
ncbi:hypothetical protein ACOMHN_001199 [Nucella lapillus]